MITDAVEELKAQLEKHDGGSLKPASDEEIARALEFGFPDVLIDFYRKAAPQRSCVELDQRIWSVGSAIMENRDCVPGAYLFPLGYVVFASNKFGDAYCIDTVNKGSNDLIPVVLFPHDEIREGASSVQVGQYRLTVASDLEDFLRQFSRRTLVEKPKYS